MKYALLIYPKPGSHEELGEDESNSVTAEYWAFREDPRCLGGAPPAADRDGDHGSLRRR